MFKKAIIASLIVVFSLFAIIPAHSVLAQGTTSDPTHWWDPDLNTFTNKVANAAPDQIFGERYTYAQVVWVMYSIISAPIGSKLMGCLAEASDNVATCIQGLKTTGMNSPLMQLALMNDSFRNTRPASGVNWIAENISRFHIVPEAYAQSQGFGFQTLDIVRELWRTTRNAAYALTTLAIIILAFSVMFRVKISPQLSVTLQTAIPRVAIGLVLITFSYAIAGLLIDFAYVVQGLIAVIIYQSGDIIQKDQISVVQIFNVMNNGIAGFFSFAFAMVAIALSSNTVFGTIPIPGAPLLIGSTLGFIVAIIAIVMLVIAALSLWWTLLQAYVKLIFQVVLAPIMILLGIASPQISLTAWLRSFVATLAVFPTVGIIIFFSHILLWGSVPYEDGLKLFGADAQSSAILNPFQIRPAVLASKNSLALPTFGSDVSPGLIGYFGALILMLSIKSMTKQVTSYIESGKGSKWEGFSGTAPIGAVGGAIGGYSAEKMAQYGIKAKEAGLTPQQWATQISPTQAAKYYGVQALGKFAGMLGGGKRR